MCVKTEKSDEKNIIDLIHYSDQVWLYLNWSLLCLDLAVDMHNYISQIIYCVNIQIVPVDFSQTLSDNFYM